MTAEENIIEFMRKEILPEGYKLSSFLKKKLIQIAKDGILKNNDYSRDFNEEAREMPTWATEFCIENAPDSTIGWIAIELINSDIDDEEKLKFIKSTLSRSLAGVSDFTHPKDLPYHSLLGFIMRREGFDKKYLQYLLVEDRLTPIEEIARNFAEIFGSDMLSDEEKIVCLVGSDLVAMRRRDTPRLLTEIMKIFLESNVSLGKKLEVAELFVENKFRNYASNLIKIITVGNLERSGKLVLGNVSIQHPSRICKEVKNAFCTPPRTLLWYNDGGAARYLCRWYTSILNEKQREKFVMEIMGSSNPTGNRYLIMGVCDALYYGNYDSVFTCKVLERGLKISNGIIRSLCYEYLFLLYNDIEGYVKESLHDTDIKVQHTLARVALSPSRLDKMDNGKKAQLIELVERYGVDLNKRQSDRLIKLKDEVE